MAKKIITVATVYIVVAFLTGGYFFNHREAERPTNEWASAHDLTHGIRSITVGIVWPVYWAGRAAIEITK